MNDLPERLRRHYADQSLAPDAARRILAQGSLERRRSLRQRFVFAAAALLVVGLGLYSGFRYAVRIETFEVERRVEDFFAAQAPKLDRESPDAAALRQWLIEQGAPSEAQIPLSLRSYPSVGCATLRVGRQRAYMICLEVPTTDAQTATNGKRTELVHLVFVRSTSLRHAPTPQAPATVTQRGEWSYAVWADAEHGVTYVAVSALPPAQLRAVL